MLTPIAVGLVGLWLLCAALAVGAARAMTSHGLSAVRRQQHARRLNGINNMAAIALCAALAATYALLISYEPVIHTWPLAAHIALFASILGYVVLVLMRWLLPDLPAGVLLRRLAGSYLAAVISLWILVGVFGIWRINDVASLWYFVAIGLLAVTLVLTGFGRPYWRGAITVAQHICKHGSHARREATLKRLLVKWYPLLSASAVVMLTTALLLAYQPVVPS